MDGFDADRWEACRLRDDYPEGSVGELSALPDGSEVRAHLARALVHAAGRAESETSARKSLRDLARRHPEERTVVEAFLLVLYGDHREAVLEARHAEADRLADEMRPFARTPGARDLRAAALFNAHWATSDVPSMPRSRSLLHRLRRLAAEHPEDETVAAHLARALFNAHHQARTFGKSDALAARYAELAELLGAHPSSEVIAGELAKATYDNLVDALRTGQNAEPLDAALRRLHLDYPQSETVRGQYGRACVVLASRSADQEEAWERLRLAERLRPGLEFEEATEVLRNLAQETRARWGFEDV